MVASALALTRGSGQRSRRGAVRRWVGVDGRLSARAWEAEAEERRIDAAAAREEDVNLRWRRARVAAEGARALAHVRQEVVRVEEEGLRLAAAR